MGKQVTAFTAAPWEEPSQFLKTLDSEVKPLPLRVLLVFEVGLGKTKDILENVAEIIEREKAAGRPWRVIFAVPMHKLGKEIDERCDRAGINSAQWRGRDYEIPQDDGGVLAMCHDLEAVVLARSAGAAVDSTVCHHKKIGSCIFFSECGQFQKQKARAESDQSGS